MVKKILIAGSREYDDYGEAKEYLDRFIMENCEGDFVVIISGGCRGADAIGEEYARQNGIEVLRYPAEWGRYGRAAGPKRNRQMADECDVAVCFWDGESKGTKSLIDYMNKIGKPTYIIQTQIDRQSN